MFTTSSIPRLGDHESRVLRGSAGASGCTSCKRGSAGAVPQPSLGAAFLIGAVVILAVAIL